MGASGEDGPYRVVVDQTRSLLMSSLGGRFNGADRRW